MRLSARGVQWLRRYRPGIAPRVDAGARALPDPGTSPTMSPSSSANVLQAPCQIGSNYIDFQATSGPSAGMYVPAPGSGAFTVDTPSSLLTSFGVTAGETGQIQSLNEGTGSVTVPGPFLSFNAGGLQDQFSANYVFRGSVGPFSFVQNGNTLGVTFSVGGKVVNSRTQANSVPFYVDFSLTYNGTQTQLLASYKADYAATVALVHFACIDYSQEDQRDEVRRELVAARDDAWETHHSPIRDRVIAALEELERRDPGE